MNENSLWGYRQNVLAIIFNGNWSIFIWKNALWGQDRTFPKWGIQGEETFLEALFREIYEETWLSQQDLEVVCQFKNSFKKDFSKEEIEWKIANKNEFFVGKEDHMFLLKYNDKWAVNLEITWELIDFKWVPVTDLEKYIENKKLIELIGLSSLEEKIKTLWQKI